MNSEMNGEMNGEMDSSEMVNAYPKPPKRLKELNGFGPRSEEILADLGIHTVDEFMAIDPYALYAKLKPIKGMGLN